MKSINDIYVDFIERFKITLLFISENFGDKDVLKLKNQGAIQARNLDIRNSKISGYIFHGFGCEFRFKNNILDVEFDNDNIGFTSWSFFSYLNKINSQTTEEEIERFLKGKVSSNELKYNKKIYELNE